MPSVDSTREVVKLLTRDFYEGRLDLSARPKAPEPGWDSLPECRAVDQIQAAGGSPSEIRTFLTLVSAMDRARDSERLWANGTQLFLRQPWTFQPQEAVRRPLSELKDALATSGVSQRHLPDSGTWRLLLEALGSNDSPSGFSLAIHHGMGDAATLLDMLKTERPSGQPWFPSLQGPKISVMWIRMLADPGGAHIRNIDVLKLAVDVQVRKVSEYLSVAQTSGFKLDDVRSEIQEAWADAADDAVGTPPLQKTLAALDPALWFFGRWGCSYCEKHGARVPVSVVCGRCTFPLK